MVYHNRARWLQMGQQLLEALSWEPQRGSRFLVFDRRRGGAGLVASYRCGSRKARRVMCV